ncbi:hypothetical protein HYH02_002914 [Chlamydomonas schloesseri]|uniref:Protochlorophyllide reductase n=1 Tax=Chlamydomonas schloesseri TaxID=2026947 RepID=A0A835WRQ3_9CHLO|nr:hypothetical protein HYH02_002914 [Chlamydomonas schloesseri]|eukprot:KAG2452682.1 hypothetical protein HYH02_002914 [Chlamydomonas schloesseri]
MADAAAGAGSEPQDPPPPQDPLPLPRSQHQHPHHQQQQLPAVRDLRGRVALVTGATSGLGLEAAAALAARGATVLFGARNPHKAARVAAEIRARFPPGTDLDLVLPSPHWPHLHPAETDNVQVDDASVGSSERGSSRRAQPAASAAAAAATPPVLCVPPLDLADPASISRFAAALLGPPPPPPPSSTAPSNGAQAQQQQQQQAVPQASGGAASGGAGSRAWVPPAGDEKAAAAAAAAAAAGEGGVWQLPLHILINNAGTSLLPPGPRSGVTDWGVNGLAQVNYLGAYQLTRLLAPKLLQGVRAQAAAAAGPSTPLSRVAGRVVAVSSVTHRCYELPADPRLFLHSTSDMTYAWTKCANVRGGREAGVAGRGGGQGWRSEGRWGAGGR